MSENSVTVRNNNLPASPPADPHAAYGLTVSRDGTALKFAKTGDWTAGFGDDATKLPVGTQLVAQPEQLALAWTRWVGGKPTDRHVTLVATGQAPPLRSSLGDNDQALWEADDEGQLRDPWQKSHELPLVDQESGERYLYSTNSVGGTGALGKLSLAYSRGRVRHPNSDPVVALGAGGYQHRIKSRGYIHTPSLKIVSWVPRADGDELPKLPAKQAMNDDIPF